ncbi:hypothetical protein [Microbacterium trichothecenolyticum]|uniref:Uncharacterized protein n=1 Tax=Microbacterium trichothecenolyticum TaxID=69370 RepID=A0A0M2H122_MICTR|nr:hypothetical protein [Microbacterium trichothecenolyticum]KJL39897.1 hypothetical protein RS82_04110 [Microbacterium trichothecenolyticum]
MAGYLVGGRLVAGGGIGAGDITVRAVPASSGSFELPLNNDGSLDIDLNLPMVDPVTKTRVDLPNLLVPGRDWLAWVERTTPGNRDGDVIVEAGPIWGDPFTFPKSDRIVANGLLSYFDHRVILPVLAAGQLPRDVTSRWSGLSLRTIMKRIVQQAIAHAGAGLPIDFEPDFLGDHEREYPGADLKFVAEALRELSQVEGGPEFALRPKFRDDRRGIRWELLTGAPELTQAGDDHYWDVSVPDAHARVVSLDRDGSQLTSRDFEVGATFRNMIQDSSAESDATAFAAGNCTLDKQDRSWAAHGVQSINLYSPSSTDSYVSIGGDVGSVRLGMESGKTYVFSATGNVKETLSGGVVSHAPRERALVVHYRTGATAPWTIVTSPQVPNVVGSALRVAVTFTLPDNTSDAFIRAYHGRTGGQIRWDAFSLTEGSEVVPYSPDQVRIEAVAERDELTEAGFPLLESVTSRSSVVQSSTLQAYANEEVVRGSAHVETITLIARRDKVPRLGTYWPGDYATINVGENPRLPKGRNRVRIVGIQFDKTGSVTIECAPERVVSGYPVPSTKRTWLRDQLRHLARSVSESTRGK